MDRNKQAYEYLKEEILDGRIAQGVPLREVELAEKLKMSRSPIREALRRLEAEGIVVSYPARGTFVASVTPYDVEEVYELRTMFELFALEKAFARITDEELDRAEKSFLAGDGAFDWEMRHAADRAFHQMFIDKCGNRRAAVMLSMLNTQVERIRRYSAQSRLRTGDTSLKEHLEIIGCIRRRDLEASKDALKRHLQSVADAAMETCRMMAAEQGAVKKG